MTLDYTSHPAELVTGGKVNGGVTVQDLRNAIPKHCWERSYLRSYWYLMRDFMVSSAFLYTAYTYIPQIETTALRYAAWATYGYVQGLQWTGIWVIGHECGHSSFSPNNLVNDFTGWVLHSSLLTPYFSWQSTHRRHHIYANNLAKDHNYVPPQRAQYAKALGVAIEKVDELTEDAPIATFVRILVQQLLGWPWYMFNNITASKGSLNKSQKNYPLGNSHLNPYSSLFRPEEARLIFYSDLGIGLTLAGLYYASQYFGAATVALLYVQPYLWVNHWIVAITYLHHTHPQVPKYEAEAWTFLRGALATIDRNMGFAGKHMMHNIVEYHVIHHLFSRIPHYHTEEATKSIMPLLGKNYHEDKKRGFFPSMWESFTQCQFMEPDFPEKKPEDRMLWYKAGPSPPIEIGMTVKGWDR